MAVNGGVCEAGSWSTFVTHGIKVFVGFGIYHITLTVMHCQYSASACQFLTRSVVVWQSLYENV